MTKRDFEIAPISTSFFLTSILGFYISVIWLIPKASDQLFIEKHGMAVAQGFTDFGFAFALVFAVMFVASMVSLTYAPAKTLLRLEEYERTHKGGRHLTHKEFLKKHKKEMKSKKKK